MTPRIATAAAIERRAPGTPFIVLGDLLDSLAETLMRVQPRAYVERTAPGVSGTVGEHVRHILDHVSALLTSGPGDLLSYDHRERGAAVETDLAAAVERIFHVMAIIERRSDRTLDDPIQVTSMVSASGTAVTGWSTLGRELAFVVSHTIHHQAIIALLLAFQGVGVPERFGYAPSTPVGAR
jgi:uncharacterized damage-inducible protein DinB